MAGNREKDWGKDKKFREGQEMQVLDTLFFDFIELAKKLKPKVVVAENVKGLLMGAAKEYKNKILVEFDKAGYYCQYFLLDASKMGVPQKRERVFFICLRKDLAKPFLYQKDLFIQQPLIDMVFDEEPIYFESVKTDDIDKPLSDHYKQFWDIRKRGDIDFSHSSARMGRNKNAQFQYKYLYNEKVSNTICASGNCVLFDSPRFRNKTELCKCGSYPLDYDFNKNKPEYLIGMSVPPVMTAQIATRIYDYWLKGIGENNG